MTSIGHTDVWYSAKQPLGVNTIRKMMKEACRRLGSPGTTGHSFHRLFITSLANHPGVSVNMALKSSGHNSVAAQLLYQMSEDHEV